MSETVSEGGAPPGGPAIVLVEPQLAENIGMAARAMANFGLDDLRLVAPREKWPNDKARAAAAHAVSVIDGATAHASLEEAIGDLNLVLATSARARDMYKQVAGPEAAAARIGAHIAAGGAAGILFGRERWGLTNEEVALADLLVTLPVVAGSGSLNIAQAVLVMAYEWRRTSLGGGLPFKGDMGEPATRGELAGLLGHLEEALDRAGFFPTPAKRPSMVVNLRAMLSRSGFNAQEVRTLRGVIAALERGRGG